MSKMLKASKRLIVAIAALLASVILCIGVCLAWFANNSNVRGNGLDSDLKDSDILTFDVTAYYLNRSGTSYVKAPAPAGGNTQDAFGFDITVDFNSDGILNEENGDDEMRPYTTMDTYATAVLFEIDYDIRNSDKVYRIFVSCPDQNVLEVVEKSSQDDTYESPLSNSVDFSAASTSDGGSTYQSGVNMGAFVDADEDFEKLFKINCFTGIRPVADNTGNGSFSGKYYLVMDYDSALFAYLSSLMLANGGSLNSQLLFGGDITIGIEVYDPEDIVIPVSIELANGDTARLTQEQGVDIMSPTWQFKVTFSDGSTRTVKGSSGNVGVDIDTLSTVGDLTATVSYTFEGETVTTTVDYTITQGSHTHRYDLTSITEPTKLTTGVATLTCAVCSETQELTLPVLTDTRYRITNNTATTAAGGTGTYTITVHGVTVSFTAPTDRLPDETIHVTGITLGSSTLALTVGETSSLTANVVPSNATDKSVGWASDATGVATVSSTGVVTAVGPGTAVITATTNDGRYTASCTVTVQGIAVTSVTLNKTSLELDVGDTDTLTATVLPANATNPAVRWTVSPSGVVTVVDGAVTAVGGGTATITATAGDVSATCSVTVNFTAYSITYVLGGGTNNASNPATYTEADTITLKNPTRSGWIFDGWFSGGTQVAQIPAGSSGNITLTALWSQDTTISGATSNYTYGARSDGWTPSNPSAFNTSNDATPVAGARLAQGTPDAELTVKVSGNKITVSNVVGFTQGSTSAQQYLDIVCYDADNEVVGTIKGTTPAQKKSGAITLTDGGVIESETTIAKVVFRCNTNGKSVSIVSATVKVETVAAHEHTYATAWSHDNTNHWHAATCEHTSLKSGEAAHTYDSGVVSGSTKTYTCTVCGYSYDEHVHTYATDWTYDATNHWHAATCEHTTLKSGNAAHTYDSGVVTTPATATEDGVKTYTCTVCGRTYTEDIPATGLEYTAAGSYTFSGTNTMFVNNGASVSGSTISFSKNDNKMEVHLVLEAGTKITIDATGASTSSGNANEVTVTATGATPASATFLSVPADRSSATDSIVLTATADGDVVILLGRTNGKGMNITALTVHVAHEHTYATGWTYDDTNHWHAASCSHAAAGVSGTAAHTYGAGVVSGDTTTYTCTVCGRSYTESGSSSGEYTFNSNLAKNTEVTCGAAKLVSSADCSATACNVTTDDGHTFTSALCPSGSKNSFTVTATSNCTVTLYVNCVDSSLRDNNGTISWTVNDSASGSSTGTTPGMTKVQVTLAAGEVLVVSTNNNKLALYGIVVA